MTANHRRALSFCVDFFLAQGEPWATLGAPALREMLVKLAPTGQSIAHLVRYLRDVTGMVAMDRDPKMPRQVQRLLRTMRANGYLVELPHCARCREERLLTQTLHDGVRACANCAKETYTRRCDECGQSRPISSSRGGLSYCNTCWRRHDQARKACVNCGNVRLVHTRTGSGPLCSECAPGRIEPCVHCGHTKRVRVRFTGGATCDSCFYVIRNTRRPCPRCSTVTLIAAVSDEGTLTCSTCAGRPSSFVCVDCGAEDIRHGKRCYRCAARVEVDALFAAGTPRMRVELAPLRTRLLAHPEPKSMVLWPKRSASAAILGEMLREEIPLSHHALDEHPVGRAASLLRFALVDVGALETRDDGWAGFNRWLDRFLCDHPDEISRTLTPFCRWEVAARTRLLIRRNGLTDGTFTRARRLCRAAHAFLAYLHSENLHLADAPQSALEDYLEDHPREQEHLRNFLRWAAETGLALRIRPIPARWADPTTSYTIDIYRAWMARFATDETIPLRARICGLLSGTTGRPSSTTAKLTRSSIDDTGERMTIRIGLSPVQLRRPLSDLIRRQLDEPRRWDTESDWLFPSKLRAGAHTDYSRFVTDLQKIGCSVVALRGAALVNLAATMPVGPLVDLTGISVNVATRWQVVAAAAYAQYPALRLD